MENSKEILNTLIYAYGHATLSRIKPSYHLIVNSMNHEQLSELKNDINDVISIEAKKLASTDAKGNKKVIRNLEVLQFI